jgi:hypothetical protein
LGAFWGILFFHIPPSLYPFTLGPPSFHPRFRLCFELDKNGPQMGGGLSSHAHSTIQSTTMELELNSHVVPWPPLIRCNWSTWVVLVEEQLGDVVETFVLNTLIDWSLNHLEWSFNLLEP